MSGTQQSVATQSPRTAPTILSFYRAHLSLAKKRKSDYVRAEATATFLSVGASVVPWSAIAVALALLSTASKVTGKLRLSEAKKLFRIGERQRRYDFYKRTLGWAQPPRERVDMHIQNSGSEVQGLAAKLASREARYYAHEGPPSTQRLFCNLAESMFWSERLFSAMAKIWWRRFACAVALVVAILAILVLSDAHERALFAVKLVSSVVALLVAVDVFGEAKSSSRGKEEVGDLLRVLETEMARQHPAQDEALRLLVEYNCLLADLPMVPDAVYRSNVSILNAAWDEYETSLPFRCAVEAPAGATQPLG